MFIMPRCEHQQPLASSPLPLPILETPPPANQLPYGRPACGIEADAADSGFARYFELR